MAGSAEEWSRRRRRPWLGLVALSAALALVALPNRAGLAIWARKTFLPRYREVARGKAAGAIITYEHDSWNDLGLDGWFGSDRVMATFPDGTRQLVVSEPFMEVGPGGGSRGRVTAMPPDDSPGFGGDLDGDGQSELLIVLPSGGSGGYTTSVLYAIGPSSLVPKAVLNNVWFEDEDHNGTFEAVGFDACFAYVWTSGAGSTRPRLALRVVQGTVSIDPDRMRSTAPTDEQLDALRAAVRDAPADRGNSGREAWLAPLLRGTIELLYAGRADAARTFLHGGWRGTAEELATFEGEFRAAFDGSPYASQIRALSKGQSPWP